MPAKKRFSAASLTTINQQSNHVGRSVLALSFADVNFHPEVAMLAPISSARFDTQNNDPSVTIVA